MVNAGGGPHALLTMSLGRAPAKRTAQTMRIAGLIGAGALQLRGITSPRPIRGAVRVLLSIPQACQLFVIYAFVTAASSDAFYPISPKLEFTTAYTTYPQLEYGANRQAQAAEDYSLW